MGTGFQGRKPASAAPAPDSVPEGEGGQDRFRGRSLLFRGGGKPCEGPGMKQLLSSSHACEVHAVLTWRCALRRVG